MKGSICKQSSYFLSKCTPRKASWQFAEKKVDLSAFSCLVLFCLVLFKNKMSPLTTYIIRTVRIRELTPLRMVKCLKSYCNLVVFTSLQKPRRCTKSVSKKPFVLHKSQLPVFSSILQNRRYVSPCIVAYLVKVFVPDRVAQSIGQLSKSEVLGSIPGLATHFRFSVR